MKTKYLVVKSGWVEEDQQTFETTEHSEEIIAEYPTENEAVLHLKHLDIDSHYVEKQILVPLEDIMIWDVDKNYGRCGGFKYLDELV